MTALTFGIFGDPTRLDQARRAEELGFHSLWLGEHLIFNNPVLSLMPGLSALAAVTTRIRVGSSVYLLPLRSSAAMAAKETSTVDVISNGRLILGIGVGGENPREFEAAGVPVNERGPRTDEAIALMRALWTGEHVDFTGRFNRVEGAMAPLPVQPGGPPIWVAGRSPAAIRRAARAGDAYFPYLFDPERFRAGWREVQARAEAHGRDPAAIVPALHVFVNLGEDRAGARAGMVAHLEALYRQPFGRIVDGYAVVGSPEDCARRLADYAEAGVRYFVLCPVRGRNVDLVHVAERWATEVIPRLAST